MKKNRSSLEEISRLNKFVIVEPYPFAIDLKKSRGLWLQTVDGDKIFDWSGMYGSKLIGFNHPKMRDPAYIDKLSYVANNKCANPDYLTPECVDYYELVASLAPKAIRNPKMEIYVVNSGAEAVENMMKYMINLHHHAMDKKGVTVSKKRFLYFNQSFHGRTISTLNITNLENDRIATRDYHGIMPYNIELPFPSFNSSKSEAENREKMESALFEIESVFKKHNNEIVGVIFEILQGAGGQRIALFDFYRRLSELCTKYEILWGIDEVQTAGGQTGEIFAVDLLNLPHSPNAIVAAKKFGNGVIYMKTSMEEVGILDSTWGGNLVDMVRFCQEWKIVQEDKLLDEVESKSKVMIEGLNNLLSQFPTLIENVRGLGLYQGFSFIERANRNRFVDLALSDEKLLILGAGSYSIRFRPPLDVTADEIREMLKQINRVMQKMTN